MIIKCAWCDADMGEKAPFEDKSITAGQCPKCFAEMRKQIWEVLKKARAAGRANAK